MKTLRLRPLIVTPIIAVLASCSSILAPVPNPNQFFALAPLPREQRAETKRDDLGATTYALGPITLPAYLDRDALVTRVSATQLKYSHVDYWAEPLKDGFTSVLSQNLSTLLGSSRILAYPWKNGSPFDYQIVVEVLRFETIAGGECELATRWAIKDGRTQNEVILRQSRFTHHAEAGDTAAAVSALSAALGDLSAEIATALDGLPKRASLRN